MNGIINITDKNKILNDENLMWVPDHYERKENSMIICAAIKDTRTGAIFGGIRHGDIYSAMHDAGITPPCAAAIEGFLDEKNNFYDRYVACEIAMTNGQLSATTRQHKRDTGEKELFSEDLY